MKVQAERGILILIVPSVKDSFPSICTRISFLSGTAILNIWQQLLLFLNWALHLLPGVSSQEVLFLHLPRNTKSSGTV